MLCDYASILLTWFDTTSSPKVPFFSLRVPFSCYRGSNYDVTFFSCSSNFANLFSMFVDDASYPSLPTIA